MYNIFRSVSNWAFSFKCPYTDGNLSAKSVSHCLRNEFRLRMIRCVCYIISRFIISTIDWRIIFEWDDFFLFALHFCLIGTSKAVNTIDGDVSISFDGMRKCEWADGRTIEKRLRWECFNIYCGGTNRNAAFRQIEPHFSLWSTCFVRLLLVGTATLLRLNRSLQMN